MRGREKRVGDERKAEREKRRKGTVWRRGNERKVRRVN